MTHGYVRVHEFPTRSVVYPYLIFRYPSSIQCEHHRHFTVRFPLEPDGTADQVAAIRHGIYIRKSKENIDKIGTKQWLLSLAGHFAGCLKIIFLKKHVFILFLPVAVSSELSVCIELKIISFTCLLCCSSQRNSNVIRPNKNCFAPTTNNRKPFLFCFNYYGGFGWSRLTVYSKRVRDLTLRKIAWCLYSCRGSLRESVSREGRCAT